MTSDDEAQADPSDECPVCHVCGGDQFTWGCAQGHQRLRFKPDGAGWLARNTIFGGEKLRARRCNQCGNVQLFATQ
jgi:hypothetical protein